jgi:hypothetical protein
MQRHALVLALLFLPCTLAAGGKPDGEPANEPRLTTRPQPSSIAESPSDPALVAEVSRLVEASLEALRDGRDHRYQAFLTESLAKLPGFAPARWHSGYVQLGGAWVHVEEVPYRAAESAELRKYAELREKADERHFSKTTTNEASRTVLLNRDLRTARLPGTLARPSSPGNNRTSSSNRLRGGVIKREQLDTYASERVRIINTAGYSPGYVRAQESLALWCNQNGLPEEARVHWSQVLKQEPANRQAAGALGLEQFGGRLLSKEQIDHARRLEGDVARSREKWQEQFIDLQREAASSDNIRRKKAIEELQTIDDSNAVFALEIVTLWQSPAKGPRAEVLEPFHRAVVALVGSFDTQPCTESLVRFAVMHEQEPVRQAAAAALKSRGPREFVPLLLAAMTMPIDYDVKFAADDSGQQHFVVGARQEHDNYIAGMSDSRKIYNGWHLRLLSTAAVARQAEVEKFNLKTEEVNRRIVAALLGSITVDADGPFGDLTLAPEPLAPDPKRWWQWWYDYNEQYVSGEKPYYGYDYGWSAHDVYQASYTPAASCFAKGTPVWTLSGAKPIEQIKVGDRVLAQHPATGELSYKGVLITTLRPPSKMLTIRTGKSTITTTLGHPFFVVGKGWRMAKELTEADWICAQGQTLPIDAIEKAEAAEAHNLMVADFGTYFVGKDRILVHDNSPIPPVRLEMPGLLAVR